MPSLRTLAIRYATPLRWNASERSLARALRRFADVEADSGWQAMQIVHATDDSHLKATFFEIALEEASHADCFREVAFRTDPGVEQYWHAPERRSLYDMNGADLPTVIAEIALNETAVYSEFQEYALVSKRGDVQELFERIRRDEAGHSNSVQLVLEHLADEKLASKLLERARKRRFLRNLTSASQVIGESVTHIMLTIAFYVFGGVSKLISVALQRSTRNGL